MEGPVIERQSARDVPRSVERVLDVLETVVRATEPMTLTEVAEHNDLTPTTALRYLRALNTRGYLQRNAAGGFETGASCNNWRYM